MDSTLKPALIGEILLKAGFKTWFLYMFRIIEGRTFIKHPVHDDMLDLFMDVYNMSKNRVTLNLCPRSSKTTIAKYFTVYTLTTNPKSQFIYTSFSQDLLSQIAKETAEILEHPVYLSMYQNRPHEISTSTSDPVNDFWRDYLQKTTNKNVYTSKKIVTKMGGHVLFASIGSTITGFGCGIRGANIFSGALIIDDANKPADIRSELMRKKVQTYFTETLFTRLNDSRSAIINIQQRLHIDDLSGYLKSMYNFDTFKYPLLIGDSCTLPDQYTPDRIEELKKNNYTFSSQYQQEPIMEGGFLIKSEWFKRYDILPRYFSAVFIVCDTAFLSKKSADYSVFTLFGINGTNRYVIDCIYDNMIYPDMKRRLIEFYNRYKEKYYINSIFIENKASGISLLQDLRESGLPVSELYPVTHNAYLKRDQVSDKYTRLQEVISDIESGYVYIPNNAYWVDEFIKECEAFTGGDQNYRDDIVDTLIYGLKTARKGLQNVNWTDIKNVFTKY